MSTLLFSLILIRQFLPSAHLEESHGVGIFPAVRYDTTAGFDLVSKKYRTAAGITDRISADNLILIVTVHRIKAVNVFSRSKLITPFVEQTYWMLFPPISTRIMFPLSVPPLK